jgi:uncharacterized membrane protein
MIVLDLCQNHFVFIGAVCCYPVKCHNISVAIFAYIFKLLRLHVFDELCF